MQYIRIYEEWFWNKNKLDDIEVAQDEPNISAEELDEYIKLYKKQKEKYNFYLDLWQSGHKKYFSKIIKSLRDATEMLYKLVKSKDVVGDKLDLNKELIKIGANYISFQIGINHKELLDLMFDMTFYLNRMNKMLGGRKDLYYANLSDGQYKFKNRDEVEKKKAEHIGVDPFGEEEWNK
jgi:hypothetical protein